MFSIHKRSRQNMRCTGKSPRRGVPDKSRIGLRLLVESDY